MTSALLVPVAVVGDTEDVPLLEREAQLASLGEYAGEARFGDGRMVLVAGEAGAGKSALVEQVQRDLPDANWFWGACDGLFTPRPLGPLFDIAAKLGGELLELCRADAPREDLFGALSAKTVDHHVSAVLAKLGVPSREAAASEAARLGLAGTASAQAGGPARPPGAAP